MIFSSNSAFVARQGDDLLANKDDVCGMIKGVVVVAVKEVTGSSLGITAGLPISETYTKNKFADNQKGYGNSETTVGKLLAMKIQICCDYFCLEIILKDILNKFQNNA